MSWLAFVLGGVFLYAVGNVIDKHVVSDELRDPILCTTISTLTMFVLFAAIASFSHPFALPSKAVFAGILAGVSLGIAIFFYYRSLKHEEVTRVLPLLEFNPLFTFLLAFAFLGERFTVVKYIGIALLIIGGLAISYKGYKRIKNHWKPRFSKVILLVLFASLFFALRNIFTKYSTLASPLALVIPIMFWIAVGTFLVSLTLFSFHHPHIRKKAKGGIEHIILVDTLSTVGFFLIIQAIKIAPISLVSAMGSLQSFFVFLIATSLNRFRPKLLHEELKKTTLELKITAIIIIIAGAILIAI